jgi:hypothetical protein
MDSRSNTLLEHHMKRRSFMHSLVIPAFALAGFGTALGRDNPQVEVWKDPACGCCKDWVAHLQANGFQVRLNDTGNAQARARLGIAEDLGSCHTALVEGYAIEGHVPARDIKRLLHERPRAIGLAVPGMPVGSPGMDGAAYGGRKDSYSVLLVAANGSTSVYQRYS